MVGVATGQERLVGVGGGIEQQVRGDSGGASGGWPTQAAPLQGRQFCLQ